MFKIGGWFFWTGGWTGQVGCTTQDMGGHHFLDWRVDLLDWRVDRAGGGHGVRDPHAELLFVHFGSRR